MDGKHIVAKVKEKETARKEYREAKEKGHGAYLMEQGTISFLSSSIFSLSLSSLFHFALFFLLHKM